MEKMTGIPVEQMIGKANYEYALPFYHERRPITVDLVLHYDPAVVAKYLNMKKEGSSLISEIFIPHLNKGKGAHLWFTASPLYDTAGNLTGAIESIRDITDRKIAEQLLHDAARNWQVTFDSTQDAICLLDADQRIVMCNRAMQEILGAKNADDLIGRHCWEVVHGTAEPSLACPYLRMQGSHKRERMELGIGDRQFIVVTDPILDETGTLVGAVHGIRDITQYKRAQDALRESEERYHDVVEDQTELISRFLPDGTHVFVNDAYCRYFDKKREEIIGHRFRPVLHPEDQEIVARHIASITPEHPVMDIDQRIIMPDGSIRWQRWSDRAIFDNHGKVTEYQSVGRDITEQKKTEQALQQALKKLNILSSITRHDILNQLMAVRTYVELIKEREKDPELLEFLTKAAVSSDVIRDQIEFTRYYQNLGVQAPQWQEVAEVFLSATSQLPLGGIAIDVQVSGLEVYADPLIEKVFYNLMENSLRHGGHVTSLVLSAKETPDGMIVMYRDNGVGIAVEDKHKLFQKGFGKHTGLGLFLSREILSITGITITETGKPGTGVRFEIHIPKGEYRLTGIT